MARQTHETTSQGFVTCQTALGKGTEFNVFLPAIGLDETGGDQTQGLE